MHKRHLLLPTLFVIMFFSAVVAFFVFHHLSLRAFWLDEADVALAIEKDFFNLFSFAITDGHPIPYLYLMKIWALLFGTSEVALRSFSASFAMLSVPTLFLVAKRLWNDKVAFWAALFTSTNYFLIWYGTQNKAYALIAWVSILVLYSFLQYIRKPNKLHGILFILFASIGMYFHPWFVFILGSYAVVLLYEAIRTKRYLLLTPVGIIGLFSLPSIGITFYQTSIGISSRIAPVPLFALFDALGFLTFGSTLVYMGIVAIPLSLVFHKNMSQPSFSFPQKDTLLLCFLTLFPLLCGVLVSQVKPAFELGRYEIIALPPFLLLCSLIASWIKQPVFAAIAGFLLLFSAYSQVTADKTMVEAYKATDKTVSQTLLKEMPPHGVIITTDLSYATFSYYLTRENTANKPFTLMSFPQEIATHPGWKDLTKQLAHKNIYEKEAASLVARLNRKSSVWVLYNETNPINQLLTKELEKQYKKVSEKALPEPHINTWYTHILIYSTK